MVLGACDRGVALRSGLRDARPHLRRRRALADHRADAGRRLRLDRELAGDASADPERRLARHLSGLCRGAGAGRGAAACLRAAAHARRAAGAGRPHKRRHPRRCCRRTDGPSSWWRRRSPPMPSCRPGCRRTCSRSSGAPASMPATVVTIGALFGPAQVLARICELVFARGVHPLVVARLAVGMLLAAFALMALARRVGAGRRGLHGDVRHGQRPDHHRARRGAAGAVRPGRLRRD